MPTTPTAIVRKPFADFAFATRIAEEVIGTDKKKVEVKLVDQGKIGALDPKDLVVKVGSNRGGGAVLGIKRKEEIASRAHVVQAATDLAVCGAGFANKARYLPKGNNRAERTADAKRQAAADDARGDVRDRVNEDFWTLDVKGQMTVRTFPNVKPSEALRDIYRNGKKYAFECSTAVMIIYHKAILDHVGDAAFDKMFSAPKKLSFFRWEVEDKDFTDAKKLVHRHMPLLPGNHAYFANPDFEPSTPEWQGENVIYLGEGLFFGWGVDGAAGANLVTEQELLRDLNGARKPGAKKKASLAKMAMWIDGFALAKKAFPGGIPS